MDSDSNSVTSDGLSQRPSGMMPYSFVMSTKSDITNQTRSTTSQLDVMTRNEYHTSLGESADPSSTDFNYAAYLRERAAISQQCLNCEGDPNATSQPEPKDPFGMDAAEQQLMKRLPTCFIVIGKPGSGKTTLARLLSDWWHAIYISPDTIVEDIVDSQSELGLRFWSLLTAGMAVPEQLIMAMLSERLQREDVKHYGYVLDGFPCLSEKVLSHLDQLKLVLESVLPPTVIVHLRISDEDLTERAATWRVDEAKGRLYTWIYYTEKPKPPKKQKTARLPTEDEHEEEEEEEEEEAEGEDEEMVEEEEVEEEEEPEPMELEEDGEGGEEHAPPAPKPPKKTKPKNPFHPAPKTIWDSLMRVPESNRSRFSRKLETYRSRLMLLLEDYMTSHSPEFLIEVDAALAPKAAFDSLKYRLSVLPICRALVPVRLRDQDSPPAVSTEDEPEQITHVLQRTSPLCLRFKWTPSDFGVMCPVSLQDGRIVRGDPEFSVGFLDHFYVMANEKALSLFMQNPRRFVTRKPKPPCRVIICGPKGSGRTTLAAQLASCYSASIIDIREASVLFLTKKRKAYLEEKRKEKRKLVKQTIAERRKEEAEERAKNETEEQAKQEAMSKKEDEERKGDAEAGKSSKESINIEQMQNSPGGAGSDKDSPIETTSATRMSRGPKEGDAEADSGVRSPRVGSGASNRAESPRAGSGSPRGGRGKGQTEQAGSGSAGAGSSGATPADGATDSSGEETQSSSDGQPDPEVEAALQEYAAELETLVADVQLEPPDWLQLLQETVAETEQRRHSNTGGSGPAHGGWVIDNMPTEMTLWELIAQAKFEYDDLVCIWDDSDDFLFLQDYYYQEHREKVGENADAAKTAAEEEVKKSAEKQQQKDEERARQEEEQQQQEAVNQQMAAIMGVSASPATAAPAEPKTGDEAQPDDADVEQATLSIGGAPPVPPPPGKNAPSGGPDTLNSELEGALDPIEATSPLVPPDPPPDCPMMTDYKKELAGFSQEWSSVRSLAEPRNSPEPIILALDKVMRAGTNLLRIVVEQIRQNFGLKPRELSSPDELALEFGEVDDEVEEDLSEEDNDDEEEDQAISEAEGDEQLRADLKKPYGETGKFCPVTYTKLRVMQPGSPDFAVGYRGQLYLTGSQEAMEMLLANPDRYIPTNEPPTTPPLRLVLLGAFGAGKSERGRRLAENCGVFFYDYAERLQEVVLSLGKERIGKHFQVDVSGEEGIGDDIAEVASETRRMREAFDRKQAERRSEAAVASGLDNSSTGFASPLPEASAAVAEEETPAGGDDSDSEETSGRRPDQIGWTDLQVEVEAHLLGELEMLSPGMLDELVRPWWENPPYKETGFIMEGFPSTPDELQYLMEHHMFPDAIVVLATEPEQTVERLLPSRLAQWQERMNVFQAKMKEARDARTAERLRQMNERRKELQDEVDQKKRQREELLKQQTLNDDGGGEEVDTNDDEPPEGSEAMAMGDDLGEEEEEIDIEQIIVEEFPEPEETELQWETREEAKVRLSETLRQWHDEGTAAIASLRDIATEANIPWVEVDAKRRGHIVDFQLATALEKYTKYRPSLLQRAYPIGTNMAAQLLDVGYRQLSKFGKQCPVTLMERGLMLPPFNPIERRPYPVIFRRHIYYCVNSAAAAKFVRRPLMYTEQKPPQYLIPSRVAVIGPPKSGKTAVSCGLSRRYGLHRVSAGEAVRALLTRWPPLQLTERVRHHLEDGQPVPEPLLVAAIQLSLLSVPAQVHGFVLDGWPQNERQATALTAAGVLPYLVLELQAEAAVTVRRARRQENWFRAEQTRLEAVATRRRPPAEEPRLETPLAHCVRLASWRQASEQLGQHYLRLHGNLHVLRADASLWAAEKAARDALEQCIDGIYQYRARVASGRAAPLGALCVTPDELAVRLGPLGHYCPVCWRDGRLNDIGGDRSMAHSVELAGRYYRACGMEHQQVLLEDGEACVPPCAAPLPTDLPRRLSQLDTAELLPNVPLAFGGFCTVSYVRGGRRYEALVRGDPTIAVGYHHQVYFLASEDAREAFMSEPRRFYACVLPKKLPPTVVKDSPGATKEKEPQQLPLSSLPLPGYLEQTLAHHLVRALTTAGCRRPKHPQLGITASALVYVALLLQTRAVASECVRRRREQRVAEFEAACGLVERLGRAVNCAGSDPRQMPDRLRQEMEHFTALRQRPRQAVYRD